MYLKRLILQNTGPIGDVKYDLPFAGNGDPKPLVLVGPNGSGKSIVLSFVANALLATHVTLYENSEVEKGKVYKLRSPGYIRSGQVRNTILGIWSLRTRLKRLSGNFG